ncbi:DNRLRE domain-containing protein [Sorangium sp. So ce145]|uniref:DNRLRE domain-containing protein n=1 Tax=Sorangium sp. So ce145 TaxID=3133285 RepID=UPI003F5DD218
MLIRQLIHSRDALADPRRAGRLPLLLCLGIVASACAGGADEPSEPSEPIGSVQQALCSADDVGCQSGAPSWPRWSQQPDRPDAVFEEFETGSGAASASSSANSSSASSSASSSSASSSASSASGAGGGGSGFEFKPKACDPNLLGKMPENPNPKGADLQNITTNFHVLQSMQILSSIVNKTAEAINASDTETVEDAGKGRCICTQRVDAGCTDVIQKGQTTYEECSDFCDPATTPTNTCSMGVLVWLSNDVQQTQEGKAKWARKIVKWLDKMAGEIADGRFADFLEQLGGDLENATELLAKIQCYIDLYTEGYHLGGYSKQRPDLHMCIPWAGHGAYATMVESGNGKWGIGARYESRNLSKKHRAQMRTGGFAVTVFDETLSILPGTEFNMQLDGYKWFNREAPFGDDELGHFGGGGLSLSAAKRKGLFYLADGDQVESLDTDHDGRVSPQEFLVGTYMPFSYTADYTPSGAPSPATWPRSAAKPAEKLEGRSAAVMAAALNLDMQMKPIEKDLTKIPLPPVPGAFLIPYFRLGAGVKWYDEAYFMRKRLQEALNKHTNHKIENVDFDRDMHAFQAPDVTGEAGTVVSVRPEVGAKLFLGVPLGKRLKVGVEASIGFSVDLKPSGSGGVVDLNTSLEQALVNSNPDESLECKPVFNYKDQTYCSNRLVEESELNLGCSPLDTNNSCCLTFATGGRACIDDWTGITEEWCDSGKLSYELLATFMKEKQAKLLKTAFQAGFTAKWNANKTCDECDSDGTCVTDVRSDDLRDISGCQKHGVCCLPVASSPFGLAGARALTNGSYAQARFIQPGDMAYDASTRMLYVADRTAVRRIDLTSGAVTTIAGSTVSGTTDGVGTAARFNTISGITLHDGALYIADRGSRTIRKLTLSSGQVTTIADRTVVGTPRDVAVVGSHLYVTNSGDRTLVWIDLATGANIAVAGLASSSGNVDGVGTTARFAEPSGIVADGRGNLYIADAFNNSLRRYEIATSMVTTVAGNGTAGSADGVGTAARLTSPQALAIDGSGSVFIGEGNKPGRVRRFDPALGATVTVAGGPGTVWQDGLATSAVLELPGGLAVLPSGDIYVSDSLPSTVRKIGSNCDAAIPGAVTYDVTEAECPGNFGAYRCVTETRSDVVEWRGPGCHPLHSGFQSACGCASNADCASGETCDPVKKLCTVGGTPVTCLCSADPNPTCASEPGRTCVDGACTRRCNYDAATADTVCGYGQVCTPDGVCAPQAGAQYAEQVIWGLKNPHAPAHAIATYGMSELELIAALNAGIHIGLEVKLFKKPRKFTLWDWRRSWDIGSVAKAKFQPGLEATYQWDSTSLGQVTNYQPTEVTRSLTAPSETADFLAWCKDELGLHAEDPMAPTTEDVTGGVQEVLNFGFNLGERVSTMENLCIEGRPMMDWLQDKDALAERFVTGTCTYVGLVSGLRGNLSFPCQEAHINLLKHWGCLDAQGSAVANQLRVGAFSGAVVNTPTPTFDLTALLYDTSNGLEASNLVYPSALAEAWLAEVEACFDEHSEDTVPCSCLDDADCTTGPGQTCVSGTCQGPEDDVIQCSVVQNAGVTVERCCGDGVQQASEQCDDGNAQNGDGCSSSCLLETTGACCRSQGCTDLGTGGISSSASCREAGGYFLSGYSCAQVDACGVEPIGSCTEPDGACHTPAYEAQCDAVSGVFVVGGRCENEPERLTLQPGSDGIDATITNLSASVGANNGSSPNMTAGVWTSSNTSYVNRSLFRFDLSEIPAGSTIERARLTLYADPDARLYGQGTWNGLLPGHSTYGGSNAFLLQRVTSAWQENTVTWANQPTTTSLHQVLLPPSTSLGQDYEGVDVTELVQDMLSAPASNHGFLMRLESEVGNYREVSFMSSDTANAARLPKLEVVFRRP